MRVNKYIDIIGYIGLSITTLAAILFLLMLFGIIHSPSFENVIGTFIVGQSFYNGYLMAALKYHTHDRE